MSAIEPRAPLLAITAFVAGAVAGAVVRLVFNRTAMLLAAGAAIALGLLALR